MLRGANLRGGVGGADPLCGFDLAGALPQPPPPALAGSQTSAATILNATAVRCVSPPRGAPGGAAVLSFAPNGQNFDGGADGVVFGFAPPLVPNGSFPLGGPVAGASRDSSPVFSFAASPLPALSSPPLLHRQCLS